MENKPLWFEFIMGLLIPATLAIVGYFVQNAIKQKEINGRMLELAIQILSEKPTEEKVPIRKWAVATVNKYSEIKLDQKAESLLLYNSWFIGNVPIKDSMGKNIDDLMSARIERPHFVDKASKKTTGENK
jgi:hypothetical protein